MSENINPIIKTDYPDPDVVRVGDTFYMVSTTMYFMPGGALLQSKDLVNWELVGYLFDKLDDSPAERMEREMTEYAGGMWAPSIRYENGKFYVFFVSHSAHTNYLFTSESILGPWSKHAVQGDFHDASLYFEDGKAYVIYGNREIRITELNEEINGPKEGGLDRVLVTDQNEGLGYEGSHFYKIDGRYYLFLINWPKGSVRTQNCFVSDSLTGTFKGGPVLKDCGRFPGRGAAQGGIVDTPDGRWFSIVFQDMGAVGRIPVLCPVTFKDGIPVYGDNGKIPENFETIPGVSFDRTKNPVYVSDSFECERDKDGRPKLKLPWQWNHQPDPALWDVRPGGGLLITTGKICANLTHARNTLTQRMMWPKCEARVTVDASELNDGDFIGLCVLQSHYAMVGIKKELAAAYLVVVTFDDASMPRSMGAADYMPGRIAEKFRIKGQCARVAVRAEFREGLDEASFFYLDGDEYRQVGESRRMIFSLTHFTGNRFGLTCYSTRKTGGTGLFTDFEYIY